MRVPSPGCASSRPSTCPVDALVDRPRRPRAGRRGRRRASGRGSTASSWPRCWRSAPIPAPTASSWSTSTPATASRCRSCAAPSTSGRATCVPLATVGTVLPDGMEIGRRKMRGEWSNGMLCSARRARPAGDHDGHPRPRRRRAAGDAARRAPWASSPTSSSTSRSTPTGPTPCRWPGWPATWPPSSACRSPCPSRRPCADGHRPGRRAGHGRGRGPERLRPLRGPGARAA